MSPPFRRGAAAVDLQHPQSCSSVNKGRTKLWQGNHPLGSAQLQEGAMARAVTAPHRDSGARDDGAGASSVTQLSHTQLCHLHIPMDIPRNKANVTSRPSRESGANHFALFH